jgi:hypothetical protein
MTAHFDAGQQGLQGTINGGRAAGIGKTDQAHASGYSSGSLATGAPEIALREFTCSAFFTIQVPVIVAMAMRRQIFTWRETGATARRVPAHAPMAGSSTLQGRGVEHVGSHGSIDLRHENSRCAPLGSGIRPIRSGMS